MQLFRKLAENIFFKILLAFVALTFVLFGISGFILGSPNSWVAKVGNTTIGYSAFNSELQSSREAVLASNKSPEAAKYIDSKQFQSDVLNRLVNKVMIEKLHEEFGVEASKELILESVAKDPSFIKDGKFDHELFKKFLAKNGLNEERYVNLISNEIVASMIIQTMSMVSPINEKAIIELENFKQEKRQADVISISIKDIKSLPQPSKTEITKFFEDNRSNYNSPELRKVSYISFSKKDFAKYVAISDAEIAAEYEKNKDLLQQPESRNFYHMLFENEDQAKSFLEKYDIAMKSAKSKPEAIFIKLAKEIKNKDKKTITLANITKKDLIPELIEPIFKLNLDQRSDVLSSQLGFHVFLLTGVKKAHPLSLQEVKFSLKEKLSQGREEKILNEKISEIDDMILTSNSLSEVAKKFNLHLSDKAILLDDKGQNEKGGAILEIKKLDDFAQNSFALQKDQISKIFHSKDFQEFYIVKLEEILPARQKNLAEVTEQVNVDLLKSKRGEALQELTKKIAQEIQANPKDFDKIAAKYQVKLEKNREFPRVYYIDYQGRKVPYQNKFLDELFGLKIGETTTVLPSGAQEFVIGILRKVSKVQIDPSQINQARKEGLEGFKNEVLQEYNNFLLKKYPITINDKIFGQKEEK